MKLETYFGVTSYALVATAFGALALTGDLDGLSIVLYGFALCTAFYADWRGATRFRIPEWGWRLLAIGYIPFFFLDAGFISNSKVLALVHLTLFLSAAKLFQSKRDRDWVFLFAIAFFQMLLAAGLTFDTTFIGSLTAFLFFFVSTLAAFEVRRARREVRSKGEDLVTPSQATTGKTRPRPRAGTWSLARAAPRVRYLLGASVVQVLLIVLLTVPLFFMIPRFGGGGLASGYGDERVLTGFSDTVRLGDVASIKEDSRVVMRVQLVGRPGRYLRWRGIALDHYDGRAWSNSYRAYSGTPGGARFEDRNVDQTPVWRYPLTRQSIDRRRLLEQRVFLEPLHTGNLFAAQKVMIISGHIPRLIWKGDGDEGLEDLTGITAEGVTGRLSYTAWSDVALPDIQALRSDFSYTPGTASRHLQAPDRRDEVALDPRIAQLARDVSRSAPTPYDKARVIEAYLKSFSYSLNVKPGARDPLAEFLFETREGHCEYFATAMAMMLRTLGISSRVVNGFQMGEYNDLTGMYTVRGKDAHSWVEVLFPLTGAWVEFDPTPAAGLNDYTQGGLLSALRKFVEAFEVFWLDYVVTLDSDEQASIMVEIQHRLRSFKDGVVGYYQEASRWVKAQINSLFLDRKWSEFELLKLLGGVGLLAVLSSAIYVGVSLFKRRGLLATGRRPWWHRFLVLPNWRTAHRVTRDSRTSAVLFYEQMLALASRKGLVKRPDQTPLEFAADSGVDQISEITALYNRVRFGGAHLDDLETRRISSLLLRLKRSK